MSPTRRRARRPGGARPPWAFDDGTTRSEHDGATVEVRAIQPYQALKPYACPGCHRTIPAGVGHLVVVPDDAVDDRRHWHRSCWSQRDRRRPR